MLFSKTASVAKLFFILCFSGLFMYVILAFYSFHTAYMSMTHLKNIHKSNKIYIDPELETLESNYGDIKYILIYSMNVTQKHYQSPFIEGQYYFNHQKCAHRNCFLTVKEHLLNRDIRNFDAVVMNVKELPRIKLPELRTSKQKYVFYGMGPPNHYLTCRKEVDRYFNWTWSYKLYSDILSPFYEVRNIKGEVVAPRPNVHWTEKIATTYLKEDEVSMYQKKTKAVALFKRCNVEGGNIYPNKLRSALEFYQLTLDEYGCETKCTHDTEEGCNKMIENDYYFVLVQEKILTEDYLTDEVLKAYLNNAVPLIRSGALLNKFLPTGSYINVRRNSVEKVAAVIHYIIKNPPVYYSYFRWKRFYTFHKSFEFGGVCELCAHLNNRKFMNHHRSYGHLRKWWYRGPIDESFCMNTTTINTTEVIYF